MSETDTKPRRPGAATIALAAAGLIAAGAVGVAVFRSGGGESATEAAPSNGSAGAGSLQQIAAQLEQRLRQNPDDSAGWRDLGQTYFGLAGEAQTAEAGGQAMQRAASAYRRAAELEPGNADNWFGLGLASRQLEAFDQAEQAFRRASGADPRNPDHKAYAAEMMLLRARGAPPPAAEALLREALALDRAHPQSRYYLATIKDRRGDHRGAVEDLLTLLREAPAGAPWAAQVRNAVEGIARENRIDLAGRLPAAAPASTATAAIPGPTAEQLEAARAIPPSQQNEMARGMVDRLAQRLEANPRDADGWIMLMRSRMMLNEPPRAAEALRSGLAAFADDAATQQRLRASASELGVPVG